MTTETHIKSRITPWDDAAFVKAFELARDEVRTVDDHPGGPITAAAVQERLRAAGYPRARVTAVRTVEEALEHTAHWDVSRDG